MNLPRGRRDLLWMAALADSVNAVEVNEMIADASAYIFRYQFDQQ